MSESVAPAFVTPQRGVHRPPVVSIVSSGRPLSEGIRLVHNSERYGYILDREIEGFGLSPVENTTVASARGGSSLRHRRWAEGDMFLPITLVSPNPESMFDMFARLSSVVTNRGGFFDVVFFDPYSQEARRRTVLYDSGLETPNEVSPTIHVVGVTGKVLSPFWRGPERVVSERIAPPVKPLITADPGSPVNRWDDPDFEDTVAYEPWFVVDAGLEKQGTGGLHGTFVGGHRIEVTPGETVSVSAELSYVDGPNVGNILVRVRAYDVGGALVPGSTQTLISEDYPGTYSGTYEVPAAGVKIELGFYTASDVHANTRVRIENLDVKREVLPLATYEWEGEPHNSPSVMLDANGQIVARHLAGSLRSNSGLTWWRSFGGSNLSVVERGNLFVGLTTSSHVGLADVGSGNNADIWTGWNTLLVEPGQWVAISSLMAATQGSRVRQLVHWETSSGTQYSFNYRPSTVDGEKQVDVYQAPSGTDSFSVRFQANRQNAVGDLQVYVGDALLAVADTEAEALAQVEEYFDGDTPDVVDEGSIEGSYSFPFFPIFLADSTVQGEHQVRVEGDSPAWPVWEITGPGSDVEIIGPGGDRIFVEGEVTSPITIVTEPGKRSITDATGLIWDRMKPGDDELFALLPGVNHIKITMVGGTPESVVRAVYEEQWKTPRGTADNGRRGGV